MIKTKRIYISFFVLFLCFTIKAQLITVPTGDANTLIQNLIGQGVSVSNVALSCPNGASGTFTGGGAPGMTIESGVLLTNGQVSTVPGNGTQYSGTNNGAPGHPLLSSLAGNNTFDACVLTFDIIPVCNTLSIQFSFGSEEYPVYANSPFNDVFGFFISGTNPLGGNYVNHNMATLPNGQAVSINSVNNGTANNGPCVNCEYYVNNIGGTLVRYNGMTVTLTATISVQPCEQYSMMIGIADTGDGSIDSGVFLEENGLSCTLDPLLSINPWGSSICPGQSVELVANGGDGHIWSPSGTLNTNTGPVVIATPLETTTYALTANTSCGEVEVGVIVYVSEGLQVEVNDEDICEGESVLLTASGAEFYSWLVDDVEVGTGETLLVTTDVTTVYTVNGSDSDGCTGTANATVTVHAYPTVFAGDDIEICEGNEMTLTGSGAATYVWDNGVVDGEAFVPLVSTTYTVVGTTALGGCENTDEILVTVNALPEEVEAGEDEIVCAGNSVILQGDGIGIESYSWSEGIVDGEAFFPTETLTYYVVGTDINGCFLIDSVTVVVTYDVPVDAGDDLFVCSGEDVVLTAINADVFVWDNGLGEGATHAITLDVGEYTFAVQGTDASGCIGFDTVNVVVYSLPEPVITGEDSYCQGGSVVLDAGAVYVGYLWSNGAETQTINASILDNPITVTVVDTNGCSGLSSNSYELTEYLMTESTMVIGICQGDSIEIHGEMIYSSGEYVGSFITPDGCDSIITVFLTVHDLPIVQAGGTIAICEGEPVLFEASGALTYTWSNGVENGEEVVLSAGEHTFEVIGTDENNCQNTDEIEIIVHELPIFETFGEVVVCENEPVVIEAEEGFVYQVSPVVTLGEEFFQPASTVVYTITGANGNNCQNTDEVIITTLPVPNVFAGNNFTVCDGSEIVLTASGAPVLEWDNDVENGVPFTLSRSTVFTVVGIGDNGCSASSQVAIESIPIPEIVISGERLRGCVPLTSTFYNDTEGVLSSCTWSFSDGVTLNGCDNFNRTFTVPGCYDLTLTVTTPEGCVNSFRIEDYVCAEEKPNASFEVDRVLLTSEFPIANFVNTSTGASSYVWSFGDGSVGISEVSPSHSFPDKTNNYNVALFAYSPYGCIDIYSLVVRLEETLLFYIPNAFTPNYDGLNDEFRPVFTSGYDPMSYTLEIYNRWGEILFESHDVQYGWQGTYGGLRVENDVYIWKVSFKNQKVDELITYYGHVTVVR
jgi:gliding motility-associated-like protein